MKKPYVKNNAEIQNMIGMPFSIQLLKNYTLSYKFTIQDPKGFIVKNDTYSH